MDDGDNNEVDMVTFFMQEASDLSKVEDVNSTMKRFGVSSDDRINRRELVMMFGAVNKEMEKEIFNLADSNHYEGAKEMRRRLTRIRREFDSLQTIVVKTNQKDQCAFLEKAIKEMHSELNSAHRSQGVALSERNLQMEDEHNKTNEIEWENLELAISRIPRPSVKYSKRVIELLKAENGLIKLNQYDDARKVRLMLDRLIPGEIEKFYENFDAMIELKRIKLRDIQTQKRELLSEKIKGQEWTDHRRKEHEHTISNQRAAYHARDMNHAHCMEEKLRPEMSEKPSALWQKRQNYENSSASLRGQQLLQKMRARKEGQDNGMGRDTERESRGGGSRNSKKIFTESLVSRHNFTDLLEGTRTYR